ncbi:DUF1269 domain-containing protein [Rhodopila globiformis]|uniref:DUF1269 domain-containing protein n=1 Tax=Rhodopila globiformis TaxID=1071 RepID=A0A2S6NGY0_RHOGL|nr:DUF1269 domain-containing protein [Rhodopila globiformis]PPQ33905.1 hypothetical protein CCS01_13250 [Rhodopila globiformis]
MSDLLVIEYPTEEKAEEIRQKLLNMQNEYLIELGDAVIVTKCPEGHVRLNQLYNPVKAGAASGMFWGTLVGLLFMMPLAGAAVGAASGAISGRMTDVGINNNFMKEAGTALQSGNAALFLLIRKMTTDKVAAALAGSGGRIMRSSFDETKENSLQAAFQGLQQATSQASAPA